MKHEIELEPFIVPSHVLVKSPASPLGTTFGFVKNTSFPIHELSVETLEGMCKEFREAVFAKKKNKGAIDLNILAIRSVS